MQLFVGVRKSWRTCGMMLKCFWPLLRRKQVRRSGLQVHRTNAPTTIINKNTTKQNFQQNSKRDFATTLRIFQFWCHCLATALQVSIHTMSLWSFCNDNDWHVLACTWWNQVMLLLKRTIVFCTVRSACRYYTRATRCSSGLMDCSKTCLHELCWNAIVKTKMRCHLVPGSFGVLFLCACVPVCHQIIIVNHGRTWNVPRDQSNRHVRCTVSTMRHVRTELLFPCRVAASSNHAPKSKN